MVNPAPDIVTNSRSEVGRTSCIVKRRNSASDATQGLRRPVVCRMGHDGAFHLGGEKTGVAPCNCPQTARARGVRAAAGCCETLARAPHGGTSRRSTVRQLREPSRTIGVQPGMLLPLTGPKKVALFRSLFRGRDDVFPGALDEHQDRTHGLFPRVQQ